MAVSPDGRRAVSGSEDRTLKVWDLDSGAWLASFTGSGVMLAVAWGPDDRRIVAGDNTGIVYFLEFLI